MIVSVKNRMWALNTFPSELMLIVPLLVRGPTSSIIPPEPRIPIVPMFVIELSVAEPLVVIVTLPVPDESNVPPLITKPLESPSTPLSDR